MLCFLTGQPPASKALILFLVDCQPAMHIKCRFQDDDGEGKGVDGSGTVMTYFERVHREILTICREKMKRRTADHVGLVLFNSRDTDNEWNHESCKVALPLNELDEGAIAHLQDIINGTRKAHAQHKLVDDNDKSHLHLGIWCCEDLFSHSPEKNAARRGIYIMTCSDDIVGDSFAGQPEKTAEKRSNAVEQGCKDKVKNVVEKNILVDVWPLNDAVEAVDEDKSLPVFSPDGFFQKVLDLSIDEDAITAEDKASEIQERLGRGEGSRTLSDLGKDIEAGLVSRSQASLRWVIGPSIRGNAGSASSKLEIAVKFYSLTMETKKAPPSKMYKRTNEPVKTVTERLCAMTGQLLTQSADIESYFDFGGSQISLSNEEVGKLKTMDIPQGVVTLGFAPKKLVLKPGHNLRASWLMRPDEKRAPNSTLTFKAFLEALLEKEEVAICCIRKRSNEPARLHALVPQKEIKGQQPRGIRAPEGFHVVPLPYADDMRVIPPDVLRAYREMDEPSPAAIEAAKMFLKKTKIPSFFDHLEDGTLRNPSLLKQFAHIEAHALSRTVDENDPVTDLMSAEKFIQPSAKLEEKTYEVAQTLKAAIADDYDAEVSESKPSAKRKREDDPEVAAAKALKEAAKKEENDRLVSEVDWQDMLTAGTLKKAKVNQLQAYCQVHGLKLSVKPKKDDYVEAVQKHLEGN